jgi:hypothetical protein
MNPRNTLLFIFSGLALLVNGCSSFYGPHGLGQSVLVVCKVAPAQQEDAQRRANQYFAAVAHHQKPRPSRRYVAIQTLDPNPKQQAKYLDSRATAEKKAQSEGQSLGSEWVEPSQLHCIMVFDVVTQQANNEKCYVVGSLPKDGDVNTYESFPAEFIASTGG